MLTTILNEERTFKVRSCFSVFILLLAAFICYNKSGEKYG